MHGPAGDISILKHIDLSVKEGELVSIVGPSGSGKTSLIMVMAGLERSTEGSVSIDGKNITHLSEDKLAAFRRDTISVVFQNFHLIPTMTAQENVAVPLEFAGVPRPFKQAEKALEKVGLSHRLDHYPAQLSGGEQQRVALARAFAVKPKILFADEPTGNLDRENGDQVVDLIFDLNKKYNTTIVLITHDPKLAKKCKRVITIQDGEIIT